MKILSIIIPTYNMDRYLDRCLLSILYSEKVNKDIEIIVVNDGGWDNSLNIANKYKMEYKDTVVIIDKENKGHGSAINEGLKIAKGKYVKVVDADDWIDIDSFEKFVNDLKNINSDFVVTNYVFENVYDNDYEIVDYKKCTHLKKYDLNNFDINEIDNKYFSIHSITYCCKLLQDMNIVLDEKTFYVDMEYLILPLKNVNTFTYLNYNLYRYFIGRENQSINIKSLISHRKDHERVIKRVLKEYEFLRETSKKKYILNILCELIKTHYIIYCKGKCNGKIYRNEIRNFNRYLKNNYSDVYDLLLSNKFIKWNVNTNFIFSGLFNSMFSRIADKFERRCESE